MALLKIYNKPDDKCDELEKRLKEMWVRSQRSEIEPHLEDFFKEYDEHHNFVKARGWLRTTRASTLSQLHDLHDSMLNDLEKRYKQLWKEWKEKKPEPKPKVEVLELPDSSELNVMSPSQEEDFEDFLLQMRNVSICEDGSTSPETNQLVEEAGG